MPKDKTIIVGDCNLWIGQAFWTDDGWQLETLRLPNEKALKLRPKQLRNS